MGYKDWEPEDKSLVKDTLKMIPWWFWGYIVLGIIITFGLPIVLAVTVIKLF